MAKLIPDQLSMFDLMTFADSHKPISSLGLQDGRLPLKLQNGLQTDKSGQVAAHANPSPVLEKGKASMMSGTYGLTFFDSSEAVAPKQSLVNRLQEQLGMVGSMEFALIWKSEEYTIEAVDIPACAVNAPHIRQRLYWVAANMGNAISEGLEGYTWHGDGSDQSRRIETYENGSVAETSSRDMADTMRTEWGTETEEWHVYDGDDTRRQEAPSGYQLHSSTNNMANAESWGHSRQNEQTRIFSRSIERGEGYWHNAIWLTGADGKTRRAPGSPQSRLCSVDDGISSGMDGLCSSIPLLTTKAEARATKLKALGNAIVPQLAAEFIKAIK